MKEPFMEPLLRKMRISKVLPVIKQFPRCELLDIGCGWEAKLLKSAEPYITSGTGVDFKAPDLKTDKLKTISATLDSKLPFEDNSFDAVTLMAVLEHLEKPLDILREIHRVLRKSQPANNGAPNLNGILTGTVPSNAAKPVLEFLSYKLKIVNEAEIRDHKQYFNKKELSEIFFKAGFKESRVKYFQFGMNIFFTARA